MVFDVWCALSLHTAAVTKWPVGSDGRSWLVGWESPLQDWHRDWIIRSNIKHLDPRNGFQCLKCFTCPIVPSIASIPQCRVGSNVAFLTGRLGVSHIMHISRDDNLSRNNTSGPPDMVFNVQCVSRATYCYQMRPFLSGRLKWKMKMKMKICLLP